MTRTLVVDASIVVEALVEIRHHRQATIVFRQAASGEVELWAPDLLYLESCSALRRLVRMKSISARSAGRALEWLGRLPILAAGTRALLEDVWRWRDFLTPYDAAYVALAKRLSCPFVTADESLPKVARRAQCDIVHVSALDEKE